MPRYRVRAICVYVAGALVLLSAGAHGLLGWPSQATGLYQINAPADLIRGLSIGWYFGSAAMLAFGAILVVAGRRLWQGDATAAAYVWPFAVVYLLFGIAAMVITAFDPFFMIFVVPSLLAGLPLLGLRPARLD